MHSSWLAKALHQTKHSLYGDIPRGGSWVCRKCKVVLSSIATLTFTILLIIYIGVWVFNENQMARNDGLPKESSTTSWGSYTQL